MSKNYIIIPLKCICPKEKILTEKKKKDKWKDLTLNIPLQSQADMTAKAIAENSADIAEKQHRHANK